MAEVLRPAWDTIIGEGGLVETNWPEVKLSMTADQTDRFNWRELLESLQQGEDKGLDTPFMVMQVAPTTANSSGLDLAATEVEEQGIALHYVRSMLKSEDEIESEDTIAELILERCETMRDILFAGGHSTFQVFKKPSIDVGDNNPVNLVFLETGHPLQAGSVSFVATVWQ
jgi:hypothetical protein